MTTHITRQVRASIILALILCLVAVPSVARADTGTAELLGTVTFAQPLDPVTPQPNTATGSFEGLVTTDQFQGLVSCSLSASVVESVVSGQGQGSLACSGGGASASCDVSYEHVMTTVTGSASCTGQIMPPSPIIVCVVVYVPPNAYLVCAIVSI